MYKYADDNYIVIPASSVQTENVRLTMLLTGLEQII